ncbi:DUF6924 domain-containing protein [Actinocatenispora sera]|uniref:DUF6924 domain-containing protein n=1 Tax=Actinocatenispora sera TaxID=390989 RepID=A0A810L8F9_9ACTN|nr:hypothetical protein [Actinocatenispora sera]BCJ31583.1 hypothetical protein Asera_56910 [Actinocatenispora sera]
MPQPLPATEAALLVRTGFADDARWESILTDVFEPEEDSGLGMQAGVHPLSDPQYAGCTLAEVLALVPAAYPHTFLFVVDDVALREFRHPLLVVDLRPPERGRRFRCVPEAVRTIEANLFTDNLGFDELAASADADGVYRDY